MIEKKYLTVEEAAEYLGVSRATIYSYTSNRVIPHYKPRGRKCYFLRDDLDNFIEKARVSSQEEIEQEALRYMMNRKSKHW